MHVMIDIETLGLGHRPVILSVGAVAFSADKLLADFYVALDPTFQAEKLRREITPSTVLWWMQQSDEARAQLIKDTVPPIKEALLDLRMFIRQHLRKGIWAKGPSFDLVALGTLFKECQIPSPWDFWAERDVRTALDCPGCKEVDFAGTAHNALDDAKLQALQVQLFLRRIKG